MKVKELIEELQKFNPDGVVSVTTLGKNGNQFLPDFAECKIVGVEDSGCALINPEIVAQT